MANYTLVYPELELLDNQFIFLPQNKTIKYRIQGSSNTINLMEWNVIVAVGKNKKTLKIQLLFRLNNRKKIISAGHFSEWLVLLRFT